MVDAADYVNTAPECKLRLYAGANHSFTNDQAERDRLVQDVTAFVLKSRAAASLPVYPLVRVRNQSRHALLCYPRDVCVSHSQCVAPLAAL